MKKVRSKGHKPSDKVKKALVDSILGSNAETKAGRDDWYIRLRMAIRLAKGGQQGITTDIIERDELKTT